MGIVFNLSLGADRNGCCDDYTACPACLCQYRQWVDRTAATILGLSTFAEHFGGDAECIYFDARHDRAGSDVRVVMLSTGIDW